MSTAMSDADLVEHIAASLACIEKVKAAVDTLWFESNDGDVIHVDHIYAALGIDAPTLTEAAEVTAARLVDPWANRTDNDDTILEGERAA